MKKLLILLLLAVHIGASAEVSYCASAPVGYGKNATGGGNVSPTLVSAADELQKALTAKGQKVIIITRDITVSSCLKITASDKTLMALPGVKLISLQQNQKQSGILYFQKGSNNLILRNLTLVGPGAYDCNGWDLLCFDGVTNAWVDHCDFQDGCDGNFDNKGNTDNITVSWCRFRYLKKPKAGGSGGSADHRFSNLLGSSPTDKPADGTYNMTWAYCWWNEGCVERMLRCRNASLHFLNCYWNSSVAHYYIGPENADCYVEGCTFDGAPKSANIFKSYGGKNGAKFVNCVSAKGVPAAVSSRAVVTPTYTYTALTADASKTMITGNCGAGATLIVKTDGSVSSSCDSGETPTPDPEPEPDPTPEPSGDITWNFSDTQFANLGTISSTQTIDGLTIAATSDKTITIDASNKTYGENLKFTSRLKFGGTMGATYRYLCFAVKGSCTIEVYGMSGNSNTPRPIVLVKEQWDNTIHTWADVPGSELSKLTYQYVGGSTTLYIGSGNSGVNLYGINLIYDKETTLTPARSLNNGKTYNLLGMEVDENYKGIVIRDGKKYLQ